MGACHDKWNVCVENFEFFLLIKIRSCLVDDHWNGSSLGLTIAIGWRAVEGL